MSRQGWRATAPTTASSRCAFTHLAAHRRGQRPPARPGAIPRRRGGAHRRRDGRPSLRRRPVRRRHAARHGGVGALGKRRAGSGRPSLSRPVRPPAAAARIAQRHRARPRHLVRRRTPRQAEGGGGADSGRGHGERPRRHARRLQPRPGAAGSGAHPPAQLPVQAALAGKTAGAARLLGRILRRRPPGLGDAGGRTTDARCHGGRPGRLRLAQVPAQDPPRRQRGRGSVRRRAALAREPGRAPLPPRARRNARAGRAAHRDGAPRLEGRQPGADGTLRGAGRLSPARRAAQFRRQPVRRPAPLPSQRQARCERAHGGKAHHGSALRDARQHDRRATRARARRAGAAPRPARTGRGEPTIGWKRKDSWAMRATS